MSDPRETDNQARAEDMLWSIEVCLEDLRHNPAILHPESQHRLSRIVHGIDQLLGKEAA